MSPIEVDDDIISDSPTALATPLYLLVTLGLCGLAMLGKAFAGFCQARVAADPGAEYAGLKEPPRPPVPYPQPAQPPPVRPSRCPPRAYAVVEQQLELLTTTGDGCLDDTSDLHSRLGDVVESERPVAVITLDDATAHAPSAQQNASNETSELLDEIANGSDDAVPVKESVTVAKRNASEDLPSEEDSSMPVTAAEDEVSIADGIGEDATLPASMARRLQLVNESTTASPIPTETEPEVPPLGTLPLDNTSLKALFLLAPNCPSYNIFVQLRSIAIARNESHSQDFADLPEEQKREVFEDTLVYATLKTIATAQRPQGVSDDHPKFVDEQTMRTSDDAEGDCLETRNATQEQLAQSIPGKNVDLSVSSCPNSRTEAVQNPPIPVESLMAGEPMEKARDNKCKCGFSWSEDVEEEEERRQKEEQERRQQDDVRAAST